MSSTAVPRKIYLRVWVALLLLLALTWGLANVDLGPFNNLAALGIAVVKMLLVVLFFMHGKYEKPMTWIFITAGLIWFLIMIDLTMSDYLTRGSVTGIRQSWQHPQQNPPTIQPSDDTHSLQP